MTNDETREEVLDAETTEQEVTGENTESEDNSKSELTKEQKEAIAKRNLKKIQKDFPHLLKQDESVKEEKKEQTQSSDKVLTFEENLIAIELANKGADVVSSLEVISKIAKRDGVSAKDAYQSDEFANWRETQIAIEKRKAAQLKATNGGNGSGNKKDFNTPGLSEADHRELFNRRLGR